VSSARVVALDDLLRVADADPAQPDWLPVRAPLGISAFGVNAWTASRVGEHCVERHDEREDDGSAAGGHEELYVVLRGRARFVVDGEAHDAPAGTLVAVLDPAAVREAVAEEEGTVVLAVGARPGVAFEPSPWELRALAARGVEARVPGQAGPGLPPARP
jgi:hypothetical protein